MNHEETPETRDDAEVVAQLREADTESREAANCDCGVDHEEIPGLDGLMDYLMGQFGQLEEKAAEHAAHEERMKVVSASMRDSLSAADAAIEEEFDHDRLSWGIWKSKCGCVHLGLPNGKGGWATRPEELEEVATSGQMKEVVQAIAQTGAVVLEVAQGMEQEGR